MKHRKKTTDLPADSSIETSLLSAGKKPAKKKLPAWVIIPILAVLLLAVWGISLLTDGGDSSASGTFLNVVKVQKGTVTEVYNSSGIIESENTKTYYSPVTAPISECKAVVGQTVKSGDLLVTFDTTNLERDNQQAQLTLQSSLNSSKASKEQNARAVSAAKAASAQAAEQANKLAEEVNNLAEKANAAYARYQENLKAAGSQTQANQALREELQSLISGKQKIVTANQSVIDSIDSGYSGRRADLNAALLVPEAERTEEQKNLIQSLQPVFEQYDAAVAARDEAQAEIDSATARLDSIQDPDVDDAGYADLKAQYDAKYAEWQAAYQAAGADTTDTGMTGTEIANLDISDNLAELAAMTPRELLEKGREGMKADMDGVIASVDALQSNTASQGMALFTIASTEDVRVKLEISPEDYDKMKSGNAATVTLAGSTYEGTLTDVDRIALTNEKGTPVIGARIHINNPDENICIGASAKVRMTVAEAKDVLVLPIGAVNASTDGDFVYVIENGTVREKPVQLGISSATQVEITEGLTEGDLVVNDFSTDITPGMKAIASESASE